MSRKRRDRLTIMAQLLNIAREEILKTQLMYRANLSFPSIDEYVDFLLEIGLLDPVEMGGHTFYKTTRKGMIYLENFAGVKHLLDRDEYKYYELQHSMQRIRSNIKSLKEEINKLDRNLDLADSCPSCGSYILSDFRMCPYCGKKLSSSIETVKEEG